MNIYMNITVGLSLGVLIILTFTATETVSVLHSPVYVRAEAINGSRVIIVKWSNQVDVPYYKAGIKYKYEFGTSASHIFSAASGFYLSADNATQSYCFKTMGGSCPKEFANVGATTLGPGRQWTYGSEIEIRAGACPSNESDKCLMSSWKMFMVPLGVPNAVGHVTAKAVGGLAIMVSWTPPNEPRGPLTKYIVAYKSTEGDLVKTKQSDGIKTYITLTGLEPNTNYTLWVTAYNTRHEGKKSGNVTQLTFKDVCSPNPCQNSGTCSASGCDCSGDWKGARCGEPKGFKVVAGKCFGSAAEKSRLLAIYNVTLADCRTKCLLKDNPAAPCKSFSYELGYVGHGESTAELRTKGLGRCSLYTTANETLLDVPCSGDYYEVAPPEAHSSATPLQTGLTSLFVSLCLLLVSRV